MKSFTFNRFLGVARWDLTINRPFYTKMLVIIGAVICLPVLIKYISTISVLTGAGFTAEARQMLALKYEGGAAALTGFGLVPFIMTVLMGYMFHNLLTRQGRINELTLPATNMERFLWHVCFIVLGGALACLASFLVADVLNVLLGWIILGQTSFSSITLAFMKQQVEMFQSLLGNYLFGSIIATIFLIMTGVLNFSLFALGNAWKYRHNIAHTVLYLMGFGLLLIMVIGGIGSFLVTHSDSLKKINSFFDFMGSHTIGTIVDILVIALVCLVWWLTYRLYKRAQITTRRNP